MGKHDSLTSHSKTIKETVYALLDQNPLLTPKQLCKMADLPYKKYRDYVTHIKTAWKYDPRKQHGLKCSVHAWRGYTFLPIEWPPEVLVKAGWIKTRARNKWFLWKEKLGRLQLFGTGRLNLYVRKPASLGRAYQLVCNAFSFTGLITDMKILQGVLKAIKFKGAHYVFPTGQRLPQLTVDLFGKSNGIIVKVGDRSHPNSIEILAYYPDWGERNEALIRDFMDLIRQGFKSPGIEKPKTDRPPFYG